MTIPSLPDNLNKLIFLLGLGLGIYTYTDYINYYKSFENLSIQFDNQADSLEVERQSVDNEVENIKSESKRLAFINNIKNPISYNDSGRVFFEYSNYDTTILYDNFYKMYLNIVRLNNKIDLGSLKLELFTKKIKNYSKDLHDEFEDTNNFVTFSMILMLIGILGIVKQQTLQDELFKRQLNEKKKYYQYCQSCLTEFDSMIKNGTDQDGSLNTAFCNECYNNGTFIEPDLTFEILLNRKIKKNKVKSKWGLFVLRNRLKLLDRWKWN
ncbi:zinc ribbon domain-containing protein [Limnovirga soli]|nr:zinc ribbon domain-containing protein [Limnovirga soli]